MRLLLASLSLLAVFAQSLFAQKFAPPRANGYTFPPRPGGPVFPKDPLRSPTSPKAKITTLLEVQILSPRTGVGLAAQRWQRVFAKLGTSVRIRRARFADEKPEIKEVTRGSLRYVTAVGMIDRSGRLVFPRKAFTMAQGQKISEYLAELKVYGKQGRPQGQPVWGLNKPQFANTYRVLSDELQKEVKGKTVMAALNQFATKEVPITIQADAKAALLPVVGRGPKVGRELKGFAKGTALALLLKEHGLGFFPLRKPDGKIALAIAPADGKTRVWPVGWELRQQRYKTAPSLFVLVPVDLDKVPLPSLLKAIEERSKVPIILDYHELKKRRIDPEKVLISHKPRKTSWGLLLRSSTVPYRMSEDLRIDERGRPFVWITYFDPKGKR